MKLDRIFEALVIGALSLLGWVYTAGKMSADRTNVASRVERIETKVDKLEEHLLTQDKMEHNDHERH